MEIKDSCLSEMVEQFNLPVLECRVRYATEEDLEGQTELEWLIQETEWVIEDYLEDTGHSLHDEYREAKRLLKRTKNGKVIPFSIHTFRPIEGYTQDRIDLARETIREVDDLKKLKRMLLKYRKEAK